MQLEYEVDLDFSMIFIIFDNEGLIFLSDILRDLHKAYSDNPRNAVNLLPELMREIEQGNVVEKTCASNSTNPCIGCGIKKALKCIKHNTVCTKKREYEQMFYRYF